jgi:hypothetical protein
MNEATLKLEKQTGVEMKVQYFDELQGLDEGIRSMLNQRIEAVEN